MRVSSSEIDAALDRSMIVIPSINGGHLLESALPSFRIPSSAVLIIDQGSTDNTEAVCRAAGVQVLQLGAAHTYTEACNIGIEFARKRGCNFVFVGNNDIVLKTDVVRELLEAMLEDPRLGIVAPSQLLVDEQKNVKLLAYRVFWNLDEMTFAHDFAPPIGNPKRIESDFCELTFSLIRMAAVDEIGALDNAYGFYHEDADFGFRLRQAGYSCAYVPNAQLEHCVSSTFGQSLTDAKRAYIEKNKRLFRDKFLRYGVHHSNFGATDPNSWNIINRHLHHYLRRFGLVDPRRPELIFSHPGAVPFDYLYTVWETSRLPDTWLKHRDSYRAVFAASQWNASVFRESGFQNVFYAPLGVETDVYHPWGPVQRLHDGKTFLWFARNQYRKGLDVALKAWAQFHPERPDARLILMGGGIAGQIASQPDSVRRWKNFLILDYRREGFSVYDPVDPIDDPTLAMLYRGVDFTVCSSRAEGFGFVPAESSACGTPSIVGAFGATREFMFDGSLSFGGAIIKADYSDKGFGDVGDWWEPDVDQLKSLLFQAHDMDATTYDEVAAAGLGMIRSRYTWRSTVMALRAGLAEVQDPSSIPAWSTPTSRQTGLSFGRETRIPVPHGVKRLAQLAARVRNRYNAVAQQVETGSKLDILFRLILGLSHSAWRKGADAASALSQRERRSGILFVGYVEANLGIAESQRNLIRALAERDIDFAIYPISAGVETRIVGPFMAEKYDRRNNYQVNVIEAAADQVPVIFKALGRHKRNGAYNILRTYWELPAVPREWRGLLKGIDEIWAPNEFVQQAFRSVFDGPIVVVPPCVLIEPYDGTKEQAAVSKRRRYEFLFSFDYYSSPYRKNPLGVIAAFREAFPVEIQDVGLIIKSTGAPDHHPEVKDAIRRAVDADPRIVVIDKILSRSEMIGLIGRCDCYVSLHRAEGFGLGMVEAMMLGKSVIGTAYSGSTDFLSEETGYPVPYTLRRIEPQEYVWAKGQVWAEPDHAAAVAALREVYANPELGARKAKAGQAFVRHRYGKEDVGSAVERRYREIKGLRESRALA
jgi:glycosyltransferase involved in cell wall biosynthesis